MVSYIETLAQPWLLDTDSTGADTVDPRGWDAMNPHWVPAEWKETVEQERGEKDPNLCLWASRKEL